MIFFQDMLSGPARKIKVNGESLGKWAVEDLRVPGLSDKADFDYICRHDMCPIWEHLINNVTNRESARLILGNIKLQRHAAKISNSGKINFYNPLFSTDSTTSFFLDPNFECFKLLLAEQLIHACAVVFIWINIMCNSYLLVNSSHTSDL